MCGNMNPAGVFGCWQKEHGLPQAARRTRPLDFNECGPRFLGSTSHVRVPLFTHHPFDLYLNNLSAYHVSVAYESQVHLHFGDPFVADEI